MAFNGKSISTTMQIGTAKRVFNYAISNPGSGTLTWSATVAPASGDWLALSQTSGTIPPDGATEFQVVLNSKTVAPGTYSATISITSNDPTPNGSASMPISMTVTATAAKVGKRVLMEEFTGTWCGWCPYGVDSLHALLSRYPDNLVVASYHNGDPMAILSPSEENFLHVAYFPGGLVDRSYFAGETDTMVDRDSWGKYIVQRLNEPNLVDVEILNKKYTPSTKQTTLTVRAYFNETVQAPLRLTLLQTETGQNYAQNKFAWPIPVLTPYYHERVVKQVIPDITGDVLADVTAIPQGTVFTQDYAFISEDSVAENCDLVAFISRGDATKTGEVIQVYTEGFADRMITAVEPPLSRNFERLQNYPNPFNPSTNVVFSIPSRAQVRISVYTMLGSLVSTLVDDVRDAGTHAVQFNASTLSSGTYLYKMEAHGSTFTRTMTVLK
jgi:thiol-disulfide isomerase/thioredoxin